MQHDTLIAVTKKRSSLPQTFIVLSLISTFFAGIPNAFIIQKHLSLLS